MHLVFHVSLLKKKIGDTTSIKQDLPPVIDGGNLVLEPEFITNTRWVKRGAKIVEENLVRWMNLPLEVATWENTAELHEKFPNLEGKVQVKGRGNDELRRSARVRESNPRY